MTVTKDSKIIIVGAGVFGLSSAYHLTNAGYKNIEIFDKTDFEKTKYNPTQKGTDSASADINKFYRVYNANNPAYSKLSASGLKTWLKWNREIQDLTEEDKKRFLDDDFELVRHTSALRINDTAITDAEKKSISNLKSLGYDVTQFDVGTEAGRQTAELLGFQNGLDVIKDWESRKIVGDITGYLDGVGRMLKADKACYYVKILLEKRGVVFHFGKEGALQSLIRGACRRRGGKVTGIVTEDGKEHLADLVIASAGPWTASLVPELNHRTQAALGNIVFFTIPKSRQDLIDKYSAYPHIQWKTTSSDTDRHKGFALFPPTKKEGILKLNFRQKRYRNPVKIGDEYISVPVTLGDDRLPKTVLQEAKETLLAIAPDVAQVEGLKIQSKLLWYTDSINSDFVIDYVPTVTNLLVVTGGSGHGFKFLPVLGQTVVDRLENKKNEYTELFRWKNPSELKADAYGLKDDLSEEKEPFKSAEFATDEDFVFSKEELARIGSVKLK